MHDRNEFLLLLVRPSFHSRSLFIWKQNLSSRYADWRGLNRSLLGIYQGFVLSLENNSRRTGRVIAGAAGEN